MNEDILYTNTHVILNDIHGAFQILVDNRKLKTFDILHTLETSKTTTSQYRKSDLEVVDVHLAIIIANWRIIIRLVRISCKAKLTNHTSYA